MTARLPKPALYLFAAFVALGVVVFVAGAASASPERAWAAYLVNLVYFFGLSLGGIVVSAMQRIVGARWGGPVLRVHEAFSAFQPIGLVLLVLLLLFGVHHLYPWIEHPIPAKAAWLNLPFMRARDIVVAVVLVGLSWAFMRAVLAPDLPGAHPSAADLERRRDRLSRLSVVFCLAYAIGMSILAWDLLMSLDPHWYSTMFPVIVFWGPLLNTIAWTILLTAAVGVRFGVRSHVSWPTWHDLGKLLFAFGIFWAYINFAQLLVIWYGNLPEETSWLYERITGPWRPVTVASAFLVWFIPFCGLLTRATKKNPATLSIFAVLVLTGLWLERFFIVYPSVLKHAGGGEAGAAHAASAATSGAAAGAAAQVQFPPFVFGLTEIGVTLGFLGLFLLCVFWFASRYPMVSQRDYLDLKGQGGHH